MHVICHGTYLEPEGPSALKDTDRVSLETDGFDFDAVFIHLAGPSGHDATIQLSTEDARGLSRELNKAAAESAIS